MNKYAKHTFMSWTETGHVWDKASQSYKPETTRAIGLCHPIGGSTWFEVAINTLRDGDMGTKDENGVYSRKWWGDNIYNADVKDVRPASIAEVGLYLKYCDLDKEIYAENVAEFLGLIYSSDKIEAVWKLNE